MEVSTCHEMVIDLLSRLRCIKCLFVALFQEFLKYDFHVDAERMIARTQEMSINICKYIFDVKARKFFRLENL